MRILLLGEYSNVHWTLAEGLRVLGHEVCVVSNGDFWKNYPRDISLVRNSAGAVPGLLYMLKLLSVLPRLRGFDVVQLINPCFLELKAEKIVPIYNYLRKHNRKMFLGGFGMDYYWVHHCTATDTFRYSDFKLGKEVRDNERNRLEIETWIHGKKGELNRMIAKDCDGIITGLYEYQAVYEPYFPGKAQFIPFPINIGKAKHIKKHEGNKIRFFIGISKGRSEYKGTDIMYKALKRAQAKYPELCEIVKAEGVPFDEYQQLMSHSDVLLDQLYSYTPAMNGLLAMAKGLVLVGGGEPENYEILGEKELKPIINVLPNEEDVFRKLEKLILERERIPALSAQSVEYVRKHHDHIKVARQYLDYWEKR